jgi:nucleotide sugar dehydrogenase
MQTKIGFIGQGWIGKHYADDFEHRSYPIVRYSLEEPYIQNKDEIKNCRIVFIAVPTSTTPKGFSYKPVLDALKNVADGSTVVIKSTILPGVTKKIQREFPELFIMHSPEFLREATAAYDASYPDRNIIGIPEITDAFKFKAEEVLAVLPKAKYEKILPALDAEMVKYVGNCFLYSKVVMMNTFHDMVTASGADWSSVREVMIQDPRIGESHTEPMHDSGRGAGGHCFIKDFEAFRSLYAEKIGEDTAHKMLTKMVAYNNHLLRSSGKNIDLLDGVYGVDN